MENKQRNKNDNKKVDLKNKPKSSNEDKKKKMEKITNSLQKVDSEISSNILAMAQATSEAEIIKMFNQCALDFFNFAIEGTRRLKREKEFGFNGYLNLFEMALGANKATPIDQFTIIVLEFASDIYNQDEKFFLDMKIPDAEISSGATNEFNIIRSEEFKKLWKVLDKKDKDTCIEHIVLLTTYAHAYFYKLALNASKK